MAAPAIGLTVLALVFLTMAVGFRAPAKAQTVDLLNRVLNQRINAFEQKLAQELDQALSRYVARGQYVLAVNVVWDPGSVTPVGESQVSQEQHKLPGFPIFIHSQQCLITGPVTAATVRLKIQALLDESLPDYYERFFRKVIPIIARMDFNRGDRLTVQKENFPVLAKFQQMQVLPEEELAKKAEEAVREGRQKEPGPLDVPPTRPLAPMMQGQPGARQGLQPGLVPLQPPPPAVRAEPPPPPLTPDEAAQVAFDEGRLDDAERVVVQAYNQATNDRQRSKYLAMQGSIHYSRNDLERAREAWERAAEMDPANTEVHTILNFLEQTPAGESQ